jgi:hypothetical protein
LEEQRVDTVYLGLEMLSWREDGTSQKFCRAPLIFLPVELESSDVRDRFKLHYTGEEVGENVSLKEKLKQEYGLKSFPQLSEPEVNEEPACTAWRAVIN